jgi:hypothetical protein
MIKSKRKDLKFFEQKDMRLFSRLFVQSPNQMQQIQNCFNELSRKKSKTLGGQGYV